jgi:hypothetical protein
MSAIESSELIGRRGSISGPSAASDLQDEAAFHEVVQNAADEVAFVALEALHDFGPRYQTASVQEFEQSLPERRSTIRRAFAQPLDPFQIRAQCHTEHVGARPATHSLGEELVGEAQKNLVCHVCERRPIATGRCELREQNSRLPNDRVDEELKVH